MESEILKEDGEVSDSDSNTLDEELYTPVLRPNAACVRPREVRSSIISSDEDGESTSNDSDSDSDTQVSYKRQKTCPMPMIYKRDINSISNPSGKKRNNIWANVLEEDELTSEIGGVGLKKIDSDRNVEAYDYSLALDEHQNESSTFCEFEETEEDTEKKEKRKKRFNTCDKSTHGKKTNLKKRLNHQVPRLLKNIVLEEGITDEQLGNRIAVHLFEPKPELIIKVVEVLGQEKALELYSETQKVEKKGGVMVLNGARRRTSGGVYLYLLRTSFGVEKSQLCEIFADNKDSRQEQQQQNRKRKRNRNKKKVSDESTMEILETEEMHLQDLFSTDDPGGTKCPGSTPFSTPAHSDQEDFDLSPASRIRSNSVALPLKEVCEKAAFEISVRDEAEKNKAGEINTEQCVDAKEENMDTW